MNYGLLQCTIVCIYRIIGEGGGERNGWSNLHYRPDDVGVVSVAPGYLLPIPGWTQLAVFINIQTTSGNAPGHTPGRAHG